MWDRIIPPIARNAPLLMMGHFSDIIRKCKSEEGIQKTLRGSNVPNWIFTTVQIQMIFPIAYEQEQWRLLRPKKK